MHEALEWASLAAWVYALFRPSALARNRGPGDGRDEPVGRDDEPSDRETRAAEDRQDRSRAGDANGDPTRAHLSVYAVGTRVRLARVLRVLPSLASVAARKAVSLRRLE